VKIHWGVLNDDGLSSASGTSRIGGPVVEIPSGRLSYLDITDITIEIWPMASISEEIHQFPMPNGYTKGAFWS